MCSTKIHVGNLPKNAKGEALQTMFAKYGEVKECEVVRHRNYAFVHMASEDDAKIAVENLNDTEFMGIKISVNMSKSTVRLKPGMGVKRVKRKRPRDIKKKKFPPFSTDQTFGAETSLGEQRGFAEHTRPYPYPYAHRPPPPMSASSQDSYAYRRPYETAYGYTGRLPPPTQMQSSANRYDFTQDPTFSSVRATMF